MKSLRFAGFGSLVRVKAAVIDPRDVGRIAGSFKKTTLARTPGRNFAGVVVKGKRRMAARQAKAKPAITFE